MILWENLNNIKSNREIVKNWKTKTRDWILVIVVLVIVYADVWMGWFAWGD